MFKNLLNADMTSFWDSVVDWCTTTGLQILTKLLVALLIWWVSFKVIIFVFRKAKRIIHKLVDDHE